MPVDRICVVVDTVVEHRLVTGSTERFRPGTCGSANLDRLCKLQLLQVSIPFNAANKTFQSMKNDKKCMCCLNSLSSDGWCNTCSWLHLQTRILTLNFGFPKDSESLIVETKTMAKTFSVEGSLSNCTLWSLGGILRWGRWPSQLGHHAEVSF